GKKFWELYLYNDPPIWDAYVDCAKFFDIDSLMDGYFPLRFEDEIDKRPWQKYFVFKDEKKLVTQRAYKDNGKLVWDPFVEVFHSDNPATGMLAEKIGLPALPKTYELVEGIKNVDTGYEGFKKLKARLGDQGLIGIGGGAGTSALWDEEMIMWYYDHPEEHKKVMDERMEAVERRFANIAKMEVKPDFICVGGSGTLVFQSFDIFKEFAFPAVKRAIELATKLGLPTHVHSCGPEKELVEFMAENTNLTIIDPLEIPPMGNCLLADLKKLYGKKIILKGNLHTTEVMLRGSVEDVIRESKKCIDEAAAGGMFILSTGDQCGRDTPFENLRAMVNTARTYGKY
ncbi:MAG: uroporphyrinogen decarboxylase family protein, partial [Candidatus Firestonebacteria bacterium]